MSQPGNAESVARLRTVMWLRTVMSLRMVTCLRPSVCFRAVVCLEAVVCLGVGLGLAAPSAVRAQVEPGAPSPEEFAEVGRLIPEVEDFLYDGRVSEWRGRPVDQVLEATSTRPQVLLWIGQVAEGLAIAAELRGGPPRSEGDGLAIRLAAADRPSFPPIGWGHQFGFEVLADSMACQDLDRDPTAGSACPDWYRRQVEYRERLPDVFEREWHVRLFHLEEISEVRATSAFDALGHRERLSWLVPRGGPTARSRAIQGTGGGVGLEVLIPWSAFPPVPVLDLEAVHLTVDWLGPRVEDAGFWEVAPRPLANALRHHISPCRVGLEGLLIDGGQDRAPRAASEHAVPYMIPDASGDLRRLIVLDNHAAGYQYAPDPDGLSPEAFEATFEVLDVGRGERLCAPMLALATDDRRVSPPDWSATGEGSPWAGYAELSDLEVRRVEDGSLLVLSGPRVTWSYYGSGQCGGCPRVSVDVFRISTDSGVVESVLRYRGVAELGASDVEIEVSPDWEMITIYESTTDWQSDPITVRWASTRYCQGKTPEAPLTYEVCAEEDDVPEPAVKLRSRYGGR